MRSFLLVSSLCYAVVVLTACKALIRQSHSEIHAIRDAQLTLGLVPIEKGDMHAYRLLVCKHAGAYPPQLLEDDSHCRIALLDEDSTEVVFWPNDFKRDFATKYKGYIKHAAIALIAVVPLALVGRLAGNWKIRKLIGKEDKGTKLTLKDFKGGKLSSRLIDEGLGNSGLMYYQQAWYVRANEIFAKIAKSEDVEEIQAEIKAFDDLTNMFSSAAELKALGDNKRFYKEIRTMKADKVKARYDRLEEQIIDANSSLSFREEGTFTRDFFENKQQYQQLITAITTEGKSIDEIKVLVEELQKAADVYGQGLSLYEDLYAKSTILSGRKSLDYQRVIERMNKSFTEKQAKLLADEDDVLRVTSELVNEAEKARRNSSMYALGGTGLGIGILSAIDKSIWGYADRQLSRHWNQIFVADDDFANAKPVRDIRAILQALANEFVFVINTRALQLAEDG